MIMQLQLDIRESWGKRASKKIKRSMRLLYKDMAILYKGLLDLREESHHGYQMQRGDN